MPDYKRMYQTLFRAATKAITLLQEAQQATEEMYISGEDTDFEVTTVGEDEEEEDKEPEER